MRSELIPVSYSTPVFPTTSMFISRSFVIPTYPEFVASLGPDGSLIVWLDFMKWGVLSANDLNCLVNLVKRALATLPERSCCFAIGPQSTSERRGGLRDEFRIGLRLCYQKDVFIFCCLNHQPLSNWGVSLVVLSICFFETPAINKQKNINLIRFCWNPHMVVPHGRGCQIKPHARRVEDKFSAKSLEPMPTFLRCECPPSTKKVPLLFPCWLIMSSGCEDANVWGHCALVQDRPNDCQIGVPPNRFSKK